jgi:hypothetical protein
MSYAMCPCRPDRCPSERRDLWLRFTVDELPFAKGVRERRAVAVIPDDVDIRTGGLLANAIFALHLYEQDSEDGWPLDGRAEADWVLDDPALAWLDTRIWFFLDSLHPRDADVMLGTWECLIRSNGYKHAPAEFGKHLKMVRVGLHLSIRKMWGQSRDCASISRYESGYREAVDPDTQLGILNSLRKRLIEMQTQEI